MHTRSWTRASCRGTRLLACEKIRSSSLFAAGRRWGRSSARNVPSGEERGETVVFAGYLTASRLIFPGIMSAAHSLVEQSAFRLEYLHFLFLKFDFFILCGEESSWLEAGAHGLLIEAMHLEKHSTGHEVIPSILFMLCIATRN